MLHDIDRVVLCTGKYVRTASEAEQALLGCVIQAYKK